MHRNFAQLTACSGVVGHRSFQPANPVVGRKSNQAMQVTAGVTAVPITANVL